MRACDAAPEPWRARWEALRADLGTPPAPPEEPAPTDGRGDLPAADSQVPPSAPEPAPDVSDVPPPPPEPTRPAVGKRTLLLAAGLAVLAIALGFVLGRVTVPDPPVLPQTVEAIEVQNKVALGADRLVEDRTPAYLSTEALSYCASPSRSCKVPGTEMASGAAIVASCWTTGQMMWNVDLADPDQERNPDRAQSDLWYRASFPDGRTGYLSEVYVVRGDRGGRDLPRCTP